MGVTTTFTNKPINPRGNDASPLGYNRAALYSGKALDFDGVNDSIQVTTIGSVFDYGNAYTMAGYFKIVDAGSGVLMGNNNGNGFANLLGLIYKNGADSNFYPDGNSSNYVTIYSGNTTDFVHIVCTSDGTTAKAYLNGQLVGSTSVSSYTNTSSVFNVGSSLSGNFGESESAGVKVFSTALTAAQISDLYNNPEKIVPTGVADSALKLWLPMQEGAGTTAYDGSGNGNHGTISGATWTHGVGSPVAQTAVIDWNKGTNLVPYSEELDEWSISELSVVQSSATAPDGSTNAYTLTDNSFASYGICFPSSTISMSGDYVGSVFIKKTTGSITNYPGLDIAQIGTYLIIDTTNGTSVESGSGSNYSDVTITSYNDDWWRVSAKINHINTARPMRLWPAISSNGTSISSSATGSATFWGAQVESADSLGAYIPNHTSTQITSPVLLPQGLASGRDITGVNLFENVRKQGALNLDGNSWAEVHDNASVDLTDGLTLEAWVYSSASDPTAGEGIISKWHESSGNRSYLMYALDYDTFYFFLSNDGTATNNISWSLDSGELEQYNHFVCTFDGSSFKAYKNGSLATNGTTTFSTLKQSDKNVAISNFNVGQGQQRKYSNSIAQPRIYNRALTASEVLRNYNSGKSTYQ